MPMMRYAYAAVQPTRLYEGGWDRVRVAARQSRTDRSLVEKASEILKRDFDPKDYLLTHCTIVASVDTYAPPGAKVGAVTEGGKKIVRKTASYRITPESDPYINNNLDAWSRPVLLKSYRTFTGAHNFLEHVQLEEMSKGRILDAVARDIGASVYVDILVATERKHTQLVADIKSGKLSTLSMGCSIDGSVCTQCGHWAADETEMCSHVRYTKGNLFYDENGQRHRVAELCGDESLEPTGGVQFIEASWVGTPAFKGAVARNILELNSGSASTDRMAAQLASIFGTPAALPSPGANLRAASREVRAEFGGEGEAPTEEAPATPPAADELQELEDELSKHLLERVRKRIKQKIEQGEMSADLLPAGASMAPNDTVVKQAAPAPYRTALAQALRSARTPAELMGRVARLNQRARVFVPGTLYRVALQVGATCGHRNLAAYLIACQGSLGRAPTPAEARTLIRLSSLLTAQKSASRRKETL